jgi:hypothetical protein
MTQSTWSEGDSASANIDPTGRLESNCVHFASIASEPRPQQHILGMKTGEDDYLMGIDIRVGVEHVAGNRARDQRVVGFPAGYGRPAGFSIKSPHQVRLDNPRARPQNSFA